MLVKATAAGRYARRNRAEGDVFEVADGAKASWFVPYKGGDGEMKSETKPAGKGGKNADKHPMGERIKNVGDVEVI